MIVSLAWMALVASYRKLNSAKFAVLEELEVNLSASPFTREREIYKESGRRSFAQIEKFIPACFILLYTILFLAPLLSNSILLGWK